MLFYCMLSVIPSGLHKLIILLVKTDAMVSKQERKQ